MLNKEFKEFVALLNSTGVEYLIVGGYALAASGWNSSAPTSVRSDAPKTWPTSKVSKTRPRRIP